MIDHILYAVNTTLFPNVKVTQWIENRDMDMILLSLALALF